MPELRAAYPCYVSRLNVAKCSALKVENTARDRPMMPTRVSQSETYLAIACDIQYLVADVVEANSDEYVKWTQLERGSIAFSH